MPQPFGYRSGGKHHPIGGVRNGRSADAGVVPATVQWKSHITSATKGCSIMSQTPPATGTPYAAPPSSGPAARNTVGIVAFVAAVLGFVFAVWEGAYLLGWILLPIAFILSLVALFQRDKSKKLALAALIVSIVGTIAGAVAFMGSAARILDESFGSGEATVVASPTDSPAPAQSPDDDAAGESSTDDSTTDDAAAGTRENPHPLGTSVANNEWEVTVNSVDPDATAAVLAENQFNEPPADGNVYLLANVTITRIADEPGSSFELGFHYVTAAGNVTGDYDTMAVVPDELGYDELYTGASSTGNVAFEVPTDEAGTIRITPGLFADHIFFATA